MYHVEPIEAESIFNSWTNVHDEGLPFIRAKLRFPVELIPQQCCTVNYANFRHFPFFTMHNDDDAIHPSG